MTKLVAKYQKYTEYKDSGVEWLGAIPSHWDFSCLKYTLNKVIAGGTPESTNDAYWAESGFGIPWVSIADITKSFEIITTKKDVTEVGLAIKNLQILPKGTILYSIFASLGKVSIAQVPLVTNQAILGLVPEDSKLDSKYLVHWLQAIEGSLGFFSTSSTQDNLNAEKVGNLPLFNPPLNEQVQIANFLNHETAKIDTLIAKQVKLIELLKEKRQAVISHAVTKGLNPNVAMKDSGVKWLGDVPEHWTVVTLKYLVTAPIIDGPHVSPIKYDEGIPFISAEAISSGKIDFNKKWGFISKEDHKLFSKRYIPKYGDLLIVKLGATTGSVAMVETSEEFNVWVPLATVRVSQKRLNSKFMYYLFQSLQIKDAIQQSWTFGTQQTLGLGTISNFRIPVPTLDESNYIVEYLDEKLNRYEDIIKQAEVSLNLLKERRTALISSAVTGKIDVRNWQNPNKNNSQDNMELSA